jgi:hypothetical protein
VKADSEPGFFCIVLSINTEQSNALVANKPLYVVQSSELSTSQAKTGKGENIGMFHIASVLQQTAASSLSQK